MSLFLFLIEAPYDNWNRLQCPKHSPKLFIVHTRQLGRAAYGGAINSEVSVLEGFLYYIRIYMPNKVYVIDGPEPLNMRALGMTVSAYAAQTLEAVRCKILH